MNKNLLQVYDPGANTNILDYQVRITELPLRDRSTMWRKANYSLTGFEMTLTRNVAKYVIISTKILS